ncbi:peptide chain release factor 1 [bacterium]|jgi:peptide chain release factor 1|nr:peptide chain release factor 1 [bacterium]MBT4251379.1 peptide chain release factor 1 [bacterium]MBT4598240.1 peptide chain release factor 1 [bacterium]MBT6754073.1 peptide chain release factor 1 [bacterium]MBT7037893.1 peptide chain release factor 1 [bacterium]
MNPKIESFKKELTEIETELNNPGNFTNASKMKTLSNRRTELTEIIEKSELIVTLQKQFIENEEMAAMEDDEEMAEMALEENAQIQTNLAKTEEELNLLLIPKNPSDAKDVIVEIRAGAGGDEASLFAGDLFRMYSRFAEGNGWKLSLLDSHQNEVGGFKEVNFEIAGEDVYGSMKYESGVHRVQRIPETEKQGRIHTSTATVAVLPQVEEVELEIEASDLRIDTYASSGPGGQSVNTTNSAVRITHVPTGAVASCQDQKSQHKNKEKAMKVLRSRILAEKEEKEMKEAGEARLSQIGTGDRSEKIRTYNYPQDRITDHRIKQNWSNIEGILDGDVSKIIEAIIEEDKKRILGKE